MKANLRQQSDDEVIVRYLLGRLREPERSSFEERYFADDALHEYLLAIEQELIDAYVHGHLSDEDKTAFEAHFLASPERRESIEFAKTLAAVNQRSLQHRPRRLTTTSLIPRWT